MSKFKSKKLSKSSIAIILLSFALISLLAFGATFALFTASSNTLTNGESAITTGKVSLSTSGNLSFVTAKVLPGDNITSGNVVVTPASATDAPQGEYVAVKITLTIEDGSGNTVIAPGALAIDWARATNSGSDTFLDATGHWVASAETDVYVYMARANNTPASQAALAMTAATNVLDGIKFDAFDHMAEANLSTPGSDNSLMGATINVSIEFRAVQVKNTSFASADAVATYLFGTASSANGGNYNYNVS